MKYTRAAALPQILQQRIVILDGAMGTMIQPIPGRPDEEISVVTSFESIQTSPALDDVSPRASEQLIVPTAARERVVVRVAVGDHDSRPFAGESVISAPQVGGNPGRDSGSDLHEIVAVRHVGDLDVEDVVETLGHAEHGDLDFPAAIRAVTRVLDDDRLVYFTRHQSPRIGIGANVECQHAVRIDLAKDRRWRLHRVDRQRSDGEGVILVFDGGVRPGGTKDRVRVGPGDARYRHGTDTDRD